MSVYSDLNQTNATESFLVTDLHSVFQSVSNIINTSKRQRIFRRDLGIRLDSALFELMDDVTEEIIKNEVFREISNQDNRVIIDWNQTSIVGEPEQNVYNLALVFEVIGFEGQKFEFVGILEK